MLSPPLTGAVRASNNPLAMPTDTPRLPLETFLNPIIT